MGKEIYTRKYKKENAEMKIQMWEERIKQAKMSTKHQAFQTAFQYLQQDFVSQRRHFDVFREEYRKHAAQREKLIGHLLMVNEDLRA